MSALPEKPDAVAHVSDALWEATLDKVALQRGCIRVRFDDLGLKIAPSLIDHARCLILLGEVVEPVDPIEEAISELLNACWASEDGFNAACRKHFSGLTFPVQS